jgi:hypothetical protein
VAGRLRRDHEHVDPLGRLDAAVVDVEAVPEAEGRAGRHVLGDLLLVHVLLVLVRDEEHDHVAPRSGRVHVHHREALLFGLRAGRGAGAQAHGHVDAAVVQVQRVGVALAAVADDGHLLVADEGGIGFVMNVHGRSGLGLVNIGGSRFYR